MNDEERSRKQKLITAAAEFVSAKVTAGKGGVPGHPLNRGDIMILVMLIDRELPISSTDVMDPFNGKRLAAIREKLGNLAVESPQMSKTEAQQFRG